MITEHTKALNKAKIALITRADTTFFSTVCFSLKHVWDDKVKTACTNGKQIRYNPTFFMSLTEEERVSLLVHESMHVAYMHMDRLQGRDMQRFNYAADYVINLQLVDRKFHISKNWLLDEKWRGMCTEEVYKALEKEELAPMEMDIEISDETSDQLVSDIQDIIVRAATSSKMAGDSISSVPGDIQIYLDKLRTPKLPWNRILLRYIQSFNKNDYTYKKPNKKFFPQHYLPSLTGSSLIDLAIAVDTSGSVADSDFGVFVSEVASIFKMMKPENIKLIQFDTEIKSVTKLKTIKDLMSCKFMGRGGTCISPVLDWQETNKPQLLLIFSDGEFCMPEVTSKQDTLWLIHDNPTFTAPTGKVIHYAINQ